MTVPPNDADLSAPPMVFLRPWLGRNLIWNAVEWLVAGSKLSTSAGTTLFAAVEQFPVTRCLDHLTPFPCDLAAEPHHLPGWLKEHTVFLRSPTSNIHAEQINLLRASGFRVAQEGVPETQAPAVDVLLLDAQSAKESVPLVFKARQSGAQLAARNALNDGVLQWCANNGFDYIHIHFAPEAARAAASHQGTTRLALMQMLSLVVQDADTQEIEEALKREPKLSYNLLRLVNSVSISGKAKVSSFGQAITLLGRRQLQRWLQLLLYAHSDGGSGPNPLLRQAALRGRLLERLSTPLGHSGPVTELEDRAFMVGVFSLLDVLLGMPMSDILTSISLDEELEEALLQRHGLFGVLLSMIDAIEAGDADKAAEAASLAELPATHVWQAQLAAIEWAANVGQGD